MTLDEWIKKYDQKTPIPFKRDKRFSLFYIPDKGFVELATTKNMIIINSLCGDARFFREKIDKIAQEGKIKRGATYCIRPQIRAYLRLFGFKPYFTEHNKNGKTYYCINKKGRTGAAYPSFFIGRHRAYFITWDTGG